MENILCNLGNFVLVWEERTLATNFPTVWIQTISTCAWRTCSMCSVCVIYGNPASTCTAVTLCLYLYSVAGSMWIVVLTSRLSRHLGRAYDCWRGFSEASSEGKADALRLICIVYFLAQCFINFPVRQWNSGEFWHARLKTIHMYWYSLANACVYKKRSSTPSGSSQSKKKSNQQHLLHVCLLQHIPYSVWAWDQHGILWN